MAGLLQVILGSIAPSLVQALLLQLVCACARESGSTHHKLMCPALLLYHVCPSSLQVDPDELRKLKRVDAAAISKKQKLSEMDVLAVVQNDSTYLEVGGVPAQSAAVLLSSAGS